MHYIYREREVSSLCLRIGLSEDLSSRSAKSGSLWLRAWNRILGVRGILGVSEIRGTVLNRDYNKGYDNPC